MQLVFELIASHYTKDPKTTADFIEKVKQSHANEILHPLDANEIIGYRWPVFLPKKAKGLLKKVPMAIHMVEILKYDNLPHAYRTNQNKQVIVLQGAYMEEVMPEINGHVKTVKRKHGSTYPVKGSEYHQILGVHRKGATVLVFSFGEAQEVTYAVDSKEMTRHDYQRIMLANSWEGPKFDDMPNINHDVNLYANAVLRSYIVKKYIAIFNEMVLAKHLTHFDVAVNQNQEIRVYLTKPSPQAIASVNRWANPPYGKLVVN